MSLKRRSPSREPRCRILVVCEGDVTERKYFERLRHAFRNPLVQLEVVSSGGGGPGSLVSYARKRAAEAKRRAKGDTFKDFDEVWCVFDVDGDIKTTKLACQEARGLGLAVSNPCFELWALLHFQPQTAELSTAQARAQLQRQLPGYKKISPSSAWRRGWNQRSTGRANSTAAVNKRGTRIGTPRPASSGWWRKSERTA